MIDNDAARTDLHASLQQTVPPDPRPTMRCPRCARDVDPADLLAQPLAELRLLDPHVARYDHQTADGRVAICDDCDQQLAAIAIEMDTQRRRLARLWPRPTSPRGRLLDDQCLSRTFEEIRDLHSEEVLGWAVRYDQHGQDAYLIVYETGEWAIHAVPRGQLYAYLDDRGGLPLPIPVAPPAADARREGEDTDDAGDARAGSTLREIDVAALYRRRAPSDADHEPLEMDLATRFYQALYR
jgi:ribosomal protein L34E